MPRFSHPLGAVIHPSPSKIDRVPRHKPPKNMMFDGLRMSMNNRLTKDERN